MAESFGGHGRKPGAENLEFLTFCPPDVQPNTRIIALCGANDYNDNASPESDGWFLSDFYLFLHLLEDSHDFHSGNQLWFTCIEPSTLVSKYKEYLHGSPREGKERRAVLDATILPQVENDKRVRVIPARDLLERFLATLRSEMRVAQRENQPVLVLLFGHGISDTFSIPVGGQGSTLNAPRLTRQAFNATIRPGVQISVFMTSCFSGGWLTRPTTGSLLSSMERLNITGMTSVNEEQESRSWSQSVSCGRAAGGRYATAVLNALINTSSYTDGRNSNTVLDEDEGISDNPTFLSLGNSIYEAYKKTDTFYNEHCVSFSAQDDKWDTEWRSRSGFPLTDYEKRWSNLRLVPESGESKAPGGGEASDGDPSLLGFSGSIGRGYHNVVRMKAQAYMESFPGLDDVAGNVDHRQIRQLIDGTKFSEKRLTYINNVLEYRRSAMETANQYVVFLDIKFPDAFEFDAEAWLLQTSPDDPKSASKYARYKKVSEKVSQRKSLFNTPATCQGWFYMKPKRYLAIALTESDLTIEEICDGLDKLVRLKTRAEYFLTKMPVGQAIMEDESVKRHRDKFYASIGKLGSRLRSLSPSRRRSLLSE